MKWFYLVCGVAAIIGAVLWSTLIVYAIAVHQKRWPILLVMLAAFVYGAWEMFREFRRSTR